MNRYRKDKIHEHLQERIVNSYFRYFDVRNHVFKNVTAKLSKDFLLLRIFSEVYGRKTNPNASSGQIYNIFKDDLFKAYFEYKFDSLERDKIGYSKTEFQALFAAIIQFMIENDTYMNLPMNKIADIDNDILECIINEDILFRKDLIIDHTSAFANIEVFNFTLDEFRDYLIADYLVIHEYDIESYCHRLKENKSTILEGVLKYLFLKSRQSQYRSLLSFIDQDDQLFIENIFAVNDRHIENKDII